MNIVQIRLFKKTNFQGTQNIILEWRQGTNKYLYVYIYTRIILQEDKRKIDTVQTTKNI